MLNQIYLDYAATTPVDPRVAKVITDCLTLEGNFGNPASRSHMYGWRAEESVENARRHVADLLNADPREIVWTSGATESDNLAIKGVVSAYLAKHKLTKCHIVTSETEHKAVIDTCDQLQEEGHDVTYLKPNSSGQISLDTIEAALRDDTAIVSLMHINNETGVMNNVAEIGGLCRSKNICFHVDAAQSAGKVKIDVRADNIDLLSLSAHKMYGPKGMGALYVRRHPDIQVDAQMHGGGHERGMRSGTLATHQIVGLGEAARIAIEEMDKDKENIQQMVEVFSKPVLAMQGVSINGDRDACYPGILNLGFSSVDGEALLIALRDLAISTGSACTSASVEPSYVLKAMGVEDNLAHASLRFSFGRFTKLEDAKNAADAVVKAVNNLRKN